MKRTFLTVMCLLFVISACSTVVISQNNNSPIPDPSTTVKTQQFQQPTQVVKDMEKYKDDINGIVFDYPSQLSVQRVGDKIAVTHTVPFKHSPPCDFIGNGQELPDLTDFDVNLLLYNKSLKGTVAETQDDNFVKDNMTDEQMKISEGFIDSFSTGDLKGYKMTQGVEGCGQYVYYFPLNDDTTLMITRAFVPELNSTISDDVRLKAEKLENVILPKKSDEIFNNLLDSFQYTPSQE